MRHLGFGHAATGHNLGTQVQSGWLIRQIPGQGAAVQRDPSRIQNRKGRAGAGPPQQHGRGTGEAEIGVEHLHTLLVEGQGLPIADHLVGIGTAELLLRWETVAPTCMVVDVITKPRITPFLATAQARGCPVVDGVAMLVQLAMKIFQRWTGITPEEAVFQRAVAAELGE
jgi:hypothetical protein